MQMQSIFNLDIKENGCLSNDLRFLGLLLVIGLQSLFGDSFLLLTFLLVFRAEQVNIIVILLLDVVVGLGGAIVQGDVGVCVEIQRRIFLASRSRYV